jgi:LysM domain
MKGMVLDAIRTAATRGGFCAVALISLAPPARAQDSTSHPAPAAPPAASAPAAPAAPAAATYRMHTVRPGETLFNIAQLYLGDGDLWPEIYRLNTSVIADPHWIYANAVLRIPANATGGNASSVAEAPAADAAPAGAADATPPAIAPANGSAAPGTMFPRNTRGEMALASNRSGSRNVPPIRSLNDKQAAPYLDREGGPKGAGAVLGSIAVSNVIDASDRAHFDLGEDLYITMPKGTTAAAGDRFYTYRLGTSFGDRGQVVIPTGILTVIQPGVGTDATIARLTTVFAVVNRSQPVLPLDMTPMPVERPLHVDDGAKTKVLWVEDENVLTTIQYYVVLAASEKQGVHVGDQVTLYRPRLHVPESSVTLPESEIAVGQIVRVNGYAATVQILASTQPDIEPGIAAKVTARAQ